MGSSYSVIKLMIEERKTGYNLMCILDFRDSNFKGFREKRRKMQWPNLPNLEVPQKGWAAQKNEILMAYTEIVPIRRGKR